MCHSSEYQSLGSFPQLMRMLYVKITYLSRVFSALMAGEGEKLKFVFP